mmetsp:Transcript_9440/g.13959  ORF Transcript_9440/g.13959 Transcript_9440/m.13959 type:complete len:412 (+) Transcript_9440:135-1370(+)
MKRFEIIQELGEGAFATVYKCRNRENKEIVAIKKMKSQFKNWQDCIKLREVASLRKFTHPNVIKLKEVIRDNNILYLVFEYMSGNLLDVMKKNFKIFDEARIRNVAHQLLTGLAYVHKYGYMHRDLKPENILVVGNKVKLADFGLAREIRSRPPYSQYISTRWYRAPETVLASTNYNSHIDMWAVGTIIAELYTNKPLFPGTSSTDQIYKLCKIMGSQQLKQWNEGCKLASMSNIKVPHYPAVPLRKLVPNASEEALQLINDCLQFDPLRRPTASQALNYPFFKNHPGCATSHGPPLDACLSRGHVSAKKKSADSPTTALMKQLSTNKQNSFSYKPKTPPQQKEKTPFLRYQSDTTYANHEPFQYNQPKTPPRFSSATKPPAPIFAPMQAEKNNDNLYHFSTSSIDFNAIN